MEMGNNCWANTTVVDIEDQIHLCMLKLVDESMVTNGVYLHSLKVFHHKILNNFKGKMLTLQWRNLDRYHIKQVFKVNMRQSHSMLPPDR